MRTFDSAHELTIGESIAKNLQKMVRQAFSYDYPKETHIPVKGDLIDRLEKEKSGKRDDFDLGIDRAIHLIQDPEIGGHVEELHEDWRETKDNK